jgi:hypothetical protein
VEIRKPGRSRFPAVLAGATVLALLGAGVGFSADLVTSRQIKDHTIKMRDIRASTVKRLKGQTGPVGPAGPSGTAQAVVTGLSGPWVPTMDDCGAGGGAKSGRVTIAGGSLRFDGLDDGNARARVDFAPLAGQKLADLASFEYSAEYTQAGSDVHQGLPYFIVKLEDGPDAGTEVDSVVFTPGTQAAPVSPSQSGVWQHFSVTEGSARFNDDPGAAADVPWQDIVRDHGTQAIIRAGIQAGCGGAGTKDTVASVDDVVLDVAGERTAYDFGS